MSPNSPRGVPGLDDPQAWLLTLDDALDRAGPESVYDRGKEPGVSRSPTSVARRAPGGMSNVRQTHYVVSDQRSYQVISGSTAVSAISCRVQAGYVALSSFAS